MYLRIYGSCNFASLVQDDTVVGSHLSFRELPCRMTVVGSAVINYEPCNLCEDDGCGVALR